LLNENIITRIVSSSSKDPWFNLSMEEELLNSLNKNQVILFLWQNENTVVIGKNQNPWRECKFKELEADGGKLARRLSGGGAVFHDLGNLNFTLIMDKKLYDLERQLQVILDSVKSFGILAEFSGRNDLVVQGKKFSGNAYYFDEDRAYHHGTILVHSDLSKLAKYLKVSEEKIKSKGIDSVESRVANLEMWRKDIGIEEMKDSIIRNFIKIYGVPLENDTIGDDFLGKIKKIYDKHASWQWRYAETPDFDVSYSHRFLWGHIEFCFKLQDGYISEVKIYSDAMNFKFIEALADNLRGIHFQKKEILMKLNKIAREEEEKQNIMELIEWFKGKEI
jgi:lipoate-protein ligase A